MLRHLNLEVEDNLGVKDLEETLEEEAEDEEVTTFMSWKFNR